MSQPLTCLALTGVDPIDTGVLGDSAVVLTIPYDLTIVYVSAAPSVDDSGLTVDIQDDGTDVITAIAAATAATPGTWKSTHVGGTNAPVTLAAGSVITVDVNSAAAATALQIQIWGLMGEAYE